MEKLIKNARIIDFSKDFLGDIYIENGKIAQIGLDIEKECETIDAKEKVLMPAFIDMHVHFREPGFEYKEDIESGSRSAVRGGFTTVNLMGNTNPICSRMDIVKDVMKRAEEVGLIDVHQCISITNEFDGKDLSHLEDIDTDIVKIITDDGKGVLNSRVMLDAMIKAKEKDLIVGVHAEDEEITPYSYRISENIETIRDIELAKAIGAKLHLEHVSTKEAMEYIVEAKLKGFENITCEVAPHHIYFTSDEENYRVNPPIREIEDREYLLWAIENGFVDMIATDHAPHTKEDKDKGAPGMVGLETAFNIVYEKLVKERGISLNRVSELMSKNPARLLGMNKGEINIGYEADLVLLDLEKEIVIDSNEFASKGKNTPFEGLKFNGEVIKTFKAGKEVYSKE
ncbi:MAG: dihydroorotase [Andreesenia angusta]|nr:dihydroorotase [Andreesenia angusta]